jgi:hypothetical protein
LFTTFVYAAICQNVPDRLQMVSEIHARTFNEFVHIQHEFEDLCKIEKKLIKKPTETLKRGVAFMHVTNKSKIAINSAPKAGPI